MCANCNMPVRKWDLFDILQTKDLLDTRAGHYDAYRKNRDEHLVQRWELMSRINKKRKVLFGSRSGAMERGGPSARTGSPAAVSFG